MKAVTYVRVSTELQEVDRQTDQLREYCKNNKIEIIAEFNDTGSGKDNERVRLLEMLNFIRNPKNNVNCLIVHELSRLGRTYQVLDIIQDLTKRKISFYSIKEARWTIDQNGIVDPTTEMTLGFMAVINKHELETMKFRVKSGMRREREIGKALGGVFQPFGYSKDEKTGMLIKNDGEIKTIERVFQLYEEGNGTYSISKILNEDKTPTRTATINDRFNKKGEKYNIVLLGLID